MNQDIWNEFEKIAVVQGLISVADEDEQPKSKARDSLSDDAVRLLYNIEPEPEKKKSIIEFAHPETSVVGRAYDAMNSIVENEQQHQDMMAYIALKMPNGHLTQRRYVAAKKDLLDSLIRSAFTLDHQEEDGLMTLADSCAQRLGERQITKEAIAPVAVGAIAVALLGLGYYFYSGAPPAENVYQNAQKVITAAEGVEDHINVKAIKQDMAYLMNLAKQVNTVKGQLEPIRSIKDSIDAAKQPSEVAKAEAAHSAITNFHTVLGKFKEQIPIWVKQIQTMSSDTDTTERGEWMAKFHEFTSAITDTPEEKLIFALQGKSDMFGSLKQFVPGTTGASMRGGLLGAINQELAKIQGVAETIQEKAPQIHSAISQEATKPPQASSQKPSSDLIATNIPRSPAEDINQELISQIG
ncbi:hypothetical protein M0R72_02215 [Candidatus Pacearchaeota archaeon]|jgi:hypothetical protein|nr:hypothetical protein [Candidatus Pacearchaeota archaeon]